MTEQEHDALLTLFQGRAIGRGVLQFPSQVHLDAFNTACVYVERGYWTMVEQIVVEIMERGQ